MARNKVYAIVEGRGEADPPSPGADPAAKILIARLLVYSQCWTWFPAKHTPYRLDSCGDFYPKTENLLQVLDAHREYSDCAAILILFDLEDNNPCEIGPEIVHRIRQHQQRRGPYPFSVVVVCAHREYESWFLASLESIQPGQHYTDSHDPESTRDPKGWLKRQFGYNQVEHQAHYTRALNIELARERSRSFRRLLHAFVQLAGACHTNQLILTPEQEAS